MLRFLHRSLFIISSLLVIGTAVLGVVSCDRPLHRSGMEPTWFSQALDGDPSRFATYAQSKPRGWRPTKPSDFRVVTYVTMWNGSLTISREESPVGLLRPEVWAQFYAQRKQMRANVRAAWNDPHLPAPIFSGRRPIVWPFVRYYPDRLVLPSARMSTLIISIWPVLILSSVYPMIALSYGPLRRRRRRRRGRCVECGYDLTGNTSGVCPECGEAV